MKNRDPLREQNQPPFHLNAKSALRGTLFAAALAAGAHSQVAATHLDFEGSVKPGGLNLGEYVSQYTGEGGRGAVSVVPGIGFDGTAGLQNRLTSGHLYLQFNPYRNNTRGFAREFSKNPSAWQFNTFDRLTFWIKAPTNAAPLRTDGKATMELGTYVKRVSNADRYSDEAGGGHFYHRFNIPNTGTWTKVIMNMHPSHERGASGNAEQRNRPHPTNEGNYNYFDAMTRFYINELGRAASSSSPIEYRFDDFRFYEEPESENDDQIYSVAATYVPSQKRYILTWSRDKDQNYVKHEVRYSTRSIHDIGWNAATPAPGGVIAPPGWQGYNGMVYNTTSIPVTGGIYFAIKPENSSRFTQISLGTPDSSQPGDGDGDGESDGGSDGCNCPCSATSR